jgi:hypothetical protein
MVYSDAWQTGGNVTSITIVVNSASLNISPSTLASGQVGTAYSQTMTASGGVPPYSFFIDSGTLPPGLTISPGGVIGGTPTAAGTYTFVVQAFDEVDTTGTSGSLSITIAAAEAGVSFTPATLPGAQLQVGYSAALQGTGGTAPYTFALESGTPPPGIVFSNGAFSGTPGQVGTYSFTVRVTDAVQRTATRSLSITVAASSGTVFFTPTTLGNGSVGSPYSQILTGGGGTSPYTFAIVSGALPQGLVLTSTGAVVGTPLAVGGYSATVRVTDAQGVTGTANLSITVLSGLQIIAITLPPFFSGQAYLAQLVATGGQPPYTWTLQTGTLPSGLVLNGATGLISGTPDSDVSATVSVSVRDASGAVASRSFDLIAGVRPPQLVSTELPIANVGTPYSFVLIATGGSGALTWALDSGIVPPGLLLSPIGVIAGIPTTAGDYPFGLRVFDSAGRSTIAAVRLVVNPPLLAITTGPLGTVPAGPVSITFAASGGTPPYTWSLGGGALPPGLELSTGGVLSGIATTTGSFDFRVNVTDARRSNAARSYNLAVTIPPLVFSVQSLPSGAVGAAYSASLPVAGGTPPYRWSATGLPPGLSISQGNGAISGTPTADGSYRVALQVTDAAGVTASANPVLEIAPPALVITTRSVPAAAAGQPYSATFAASGGVPPYNWLIGGSVPEGLRISSGGVLSGTPTTAGSSQFTVIVADTRGTTARQEITLEVRLQPLVITLQSLPGGTVGQRYTQTITASGGVPPYTFGGTLPAGLTIDPSTGAVAGTPTTAGPGTFTLTVTDASRTTISATFTVNFALPALPPVTLAGPPETANPLAQSALQLSFGTTFPVPVTGTVTLTFRGDAGSDDGVVQFSTGGRTATFTIPANATQAVFSVANLGLQVGTTAGVITLTARLQTGTTDVTPTPAPSRQVRVSPGVPVITAVRATRGANGFDVQVTGYSSTREMVQAQYRFTAAPGSALQTTDLTVPVEGIFTTWYSSAASTATGSQFTYTQSFTIQGLATAVQSVAVTISNRQGASQSVSANLQ